MFSVHTTPEELKNKDLALKTHQIFSVHTTQQSPVTLHLCLRKTKAEKYHDFRNVIAYDKPVFKLFSAHSETKSQRFLISNVYSAFWKRFRSLDGLVWKAGLTVE